MDQFRYSSGLQKHNILTIEELRKCAANSNLSDKQLDEQLSTLLEFSTILYQVYQRLDNSAEDKGPDYNES